VKTNNSERHDNAREHWFSLTFSIRGCLYYSRIIFT